MIIGLENNPVDAFTRVMDALKGSTHTFHLTGSRFFGCERLNSDWDFFVQNDYDLPDSPVRKFLADLGFRALFAQYNDTNSVQTWFYSIKPGIHVQIVKNVDLKNRAQTFIRQTPALLSELRRASLMSVHEKRLIGRAVWEKAFAHCRRGVDCSNLQRVLSIVSKYHPETEKIKAIKELRENFSLGLREAKDIVDYHYSLNLVKDLIRI